MDKECKKCELTKPLASYRNTYNRKKDGTKLPQIRGECLDCERSYARKNTFKYIRGITIEERDAMFKEQDYRCKCCGSFESFSKKGWHVDHCHRTEKIRGVLCANCNIALGQVDDSVLHLKHLITYLEMYG